MDIVSFFVYLYFLVKPFYIFSSGSIQIADAILMIGFCIYVVIKIKETLSSRQKEESDLPFMKKPLSLFTGIKELHLHKYLIAFVAFTVIINSFYAILYNKTGFLIATLYYIFNLFAVLLFSYCLNKEKFLDNIYKINIINIFIQLIIFILGLGIMYGEVRYMGTFNDPNQFAFFLFTSLMIIYTTGNILNKKRNIFAYLSYVIVTFLIIQSASVGMLLGLATFFALLVIINIKKIFIFLIPIVLIVVIAVSMNINWILDSYLFERIQEKISMVGDNTNNPWQERGYEKIIKYPEKMLLGAGQGYDERYGQGYDLEIHGTFPSILFYYGIIPFLLLCYWIYLNLKGLPAKQMIVYIAVFLESFTLLNQRQALFWFLIVLGGYYLRNAIGEHSGVKDES